VSSRQWVFYIKGGAKGADLGAAADVKRCLGNDTVAACLLSPQSVVIDDAL